MAPRGLQLLKGDPRSAVGDIRLMMPELDGLKVIRSLRALRPQPYTCVVVLTAKDRLEDILQGLSAGAEDYLIKPFHAEELKARLLVGQRILDLQHRLMAALENAEFRGTHDALTGVYNRAAIVEVLAREVARSQRENINLAVVMANADNFKFVNDTYGHPWATKLLVAGAPHEVAPSILRLARAAAEVSNLWSSRPTVNCRTEWRSRKGSGPAVNGTDSCWAMSASRQPSA